MSHSDVIKTLVTNCGDCHSEGESFSVASLQHSDSLANEYGAWSNVRARLSDQSMPPADENTLQSADRKSLIDWIQSETRKAIFSQGEKAGPANFRRLNRNEYSNTIRDLLDIHINAGTSLPQDIAGGEGFNNASETLIISPIHAEKFLQAATESLEYAAADARSRNRLLTVSPNELIGEREAARQNLQRLTTLAFRRPVEADEIDGFLTLFQAARADGLEFDDSCFYAMRGVLVSTDFLFLRTCSEITSAIL